MGTSSSEVKGELALVLGGGIAGLASALVLSAHFERVRVIERDRYPDRPKARKHTPQGNHVHVLLAKGLEILSWLVPEFPAWLDEFGLPRGDLTQDVRIFRDGKWLPRLRSGVPFRPCTRPVVEYLLVRAARQRDNIELDEGARALGLLGPGPVRGVKVARDHEPAEDLVGDLVVDASGRSSKTLGFLQELGVGEIEQEVVDAGVSYDSCVLLPPPGADDDWILAGNASAFPDQPEMAVLLRIDGGKWLSALVAHGRMKPPAGHEQMLERMARCLPGPLREQILAAEPQSEIIHFGKAINRRRRFGKLAGWPERLVVLGDAACALNPRYGQGMTVAALGAQALHDQLQGHWSAKRSLDGLSRRFQRRLDRVLSTPWQMAIVEDRLWSARSTGREPSLLDSAVIRSSRRMLDTIFGDTETYVRFMKVAHMIDPPRSLMRPTTLAKFCFAGLRRL